MKCNECDVELIEAYGNPCTVAKSGRPIPHTVLACIETQRDNFRARIVELERWDDVADEWEGEIRAAFPTRSGSHDEYALAMQMISNRHSKQELVALVNWLLVEIATASARAKLLWEGCIAAGLQLGQCEHGSDCRDPNCALRTVLKELASKPKVT